MKSTSPSGFPPKASFQAAFIFFQAFERCEHRFIFIKSPIIPSNDTERIISLMDSANAGFLANVVGESSIGSIESMIDSDPEDLRIFIALSGFLLPLENLRSIAWLPGLNPPPVGDIFYRTKNDVTPH